MNTPACCAECGTNKNQRLRQGLCSSCYSQYHRYGERVCTLCSRQLIRNCAPRGSALVLCNDCARIRRTAWSWEHDACRSCQSDASPHAAHGLCRNCYVQFRRANGARPCTRCGEAVVKNCAPPVKYSAGVVWCQQCAQTRQTVWALDYDQCVLCGTTETPHHSHGQCAKCLQAARYHKMRACQFCSQQVPISLIHGATCCSGCYQAFLERVYELQMSDASVEAITLSVPMGRRIIERICRFLETQDQQHRLRNHLAQRELEQFGNEIAAVHSREEPMAHLLLWRQAVRGEEVGWEKLWRLFQPTAHRQASRIHLPWVNDRAHIRSTVQLGFFEGVRDWKPTAGTKLLSFLAYCVQRELAELLKWTYRQCRHPKQVIGSLDQLIPGGRSMTYHETTPAPQPARSNPDFPDIWTKLLDALGLSALERRAVTDLLLYPECGSKERENRVGVHYKGWDNAIQRVRRKAARWAKDHPTDYQNLLSALS